MQKLIIKKCRKQVGQCKHIKRGDNEPPTLEIFLLDGWYLKK